MVHPAAELKSADGVPVLELVPPVYFLDQYRATPDEKTSLAVNVSVSKEDRFHAWISVHGQSVSHGDVYQSKKAAWKAVADRKMKEAGEAMAKAVEP